ncbi:MAG: hypothetical protein KDK36_15285, partial [Leptospiraceae bacterium]|nr:hypothetical protein [Leptospiraceae bacterium]
MKLIKFSLVLLFLSCAYTDEKNHPVIEKRMNPSNFEEKKEDSTNQCLKREICLKECNDKINNKRYWRRSEKTFENIPGFN